MCLQSQVSSMQCACSILSSVACQAAQYFSTLSHTRQDLRGKNVVELNIKYMFRFSVQHWSNTFLILRRNERYMIKNVYWSSCKVPVIPVTFQRNLNFLDVLKKRTQMSNFVKIRSVGAEFSHAVGRTDRHDEANSCF
jgi:hypothetical protein